MSSHIGRNLTSGIPIGILLGTSRLGMSARSTTTRLGGLQTIHGNGLNGDLAPTGMRKHMILATLAHLDMLLLLRLRQHQQQDLHHQV